MTGVSSIRMWTATPPLLPRNPQKPVGTVAAVDNRRTESTLDVRVAIRTRRRRKNQNGDTHKSFGGDTRVGLVTKKQKTEKQFDRVLEEWTAQALSKSSFSFPPRD